MSTGAADASPSPGPLLVISGPGGVGKGTVVRALARNRPDVVVSVSATTRTPRAGEVDGRDYRFLSREQFEALIEGDDLLEWAEFNGNLYGTPWSSIAEPLSAWRPGSRSRG